MIFCVLLELIFESHIGFSCCELIFAILNELQTNHIFMFIEYVKWIIHVFKQYYGVLTLYVKPVNQITFLCHLITTSVVTDCSYDQSEVISLSADASCRLPNIMNLI